MFHVDYLHIIFFGNSHITGMGKSDIIICYRTMFFFPCKTTPVDFSFLSFVYNRLLLLRAFFYFVVDKPCFLILNIELVIYDVFLCLNEMFCTLIVLFEVI